jgi:hypothetical protein
MEVPKADRSEASGMKPQPRPVLNLNGAMPTLLRRSSNGLSLPSGDLAFDSKLSEYGDYLSRMFEVIGMKWHALNSESSSSINDTEAFVRVRFFVTKDGQIEDLTIVDSNATKTAQWRCLDAIKSNAPYSNWTKDMVVVLGKRQAVLVQFVYE